MENKSSALSDAQMEELTEKVTKSHLELREYAGRWQELMELMAFYSGGAGGNMPQLLHDYIIVRWKALQADAIKHCDAGRDLAREAGRLDVEASINEFEAKLRTRSFG